MPLVDGIWQYTDADTVSPFPAFMNKLGDSVRTRIAAVVAMFGATDATWSLVTLRPTSEVPGLAHYTTAPWSGLRATRRHGIAQAHGTIVKTAAWGNGQPIATLPVGWRPGTRVLGNNCQLGTDGVLTWEGGATSPGVAVAVGITWIVAP